ncbi:TauD/TfdA family dioxygenase [Pedobacter sp. PAMC26386]|nr:TauD/TfdA family dioxygenase [Pedobacter sp. PAMC26386]
MHIIDLQNEKLQNKHVKAISTSVSESLHKNDFGCIIKNAPINSLDLFKSICDKVGSPITEQYFDVSSEDSYTHDVIAHLCLNSDTTENGSAVLCNVDKILAKLSDIDIDILSSPIFEFSSGKAAVLTKHENHHQLRYNGENINTTTLLHIAKDVLKKLEDIINEIGEQHVLNEGDFLVINNHRIVHSRTNFSNDSGRMFKSARLYYK